VGGAVRRQRHLVTGKTFCGASGARRRAPAVGNSARSTAADTVSGAPPARVAVVTQFHAGRSFRKTSAARGAGE